MIGYLKINNEKLSQMAPDAEDCETARLTVEAAHHGSKVLPDRQQPVTAWVENEDERLGNSNSPGENKRLLPTGPPAEQKSCLQAGVTLSVQPPKKNLKQPQLNKLKTTAKNKFATRRERLAPLLKPPYFMLSVVFIIVVIHIVCTVSLRQKLEWSLGTWWKEPWRMLTYGFVHANTPHMLLNTIVALSVGWVLEREQGWWRIVCIWSGGLVAGALGAAVLQPKVIVVGASAAVYALVTAHVANTCFRYGHIPLWWFRPLSVVVLATSEIFWGLVRTCTFSGDQAAAKAASDSVAWGAHIFGASLGLPLAFLVFDGENFYKTYVLACRIISAGILSLAVVFGGLYYLLVGEGYRPQGFYDKINQT